MKWVYNNYAKKPKKWRFVRQGTYSNLVQVCDNVSDMNIGQIEIEYQIKDSVICVETQNKFGRYCIKIGTNQFKRDGGFKPFLQTIWLSDSEYKIYVRKLKMERILNDV